MKELSLKEIQNQSLSILSKIDAICREEGLTYFLAYGTLIGAVRHDGFIPWDDDIDIMIPRKDYEVLKSIFLNKPDIVSPLIWCDRETCLNYIYAIPRISDSNYIYESNEKVEKRIDIGTFVDVYVLDDYGNNIAESRRIEKKVKVFNKMYEAYIVPNNGKRNLKSIIRYCCYLVSKFFIFKDKKNDIEHKIDNLIAQYTRNDNLLVGSVRYDDTYGCMPFEKELFEEKIEHNFEGYNFYIPKHYDEILRKIYGDYMKLPPEEKRIPHHNYKIYQKESKPSKAEC